MTLALQNQARDLLRHRLRELNMTQVELARRMGWSTKHVNQILRGYAGTNLAGLDELSLALGIRWALSYTTI